MAVGKCAVQQLTAGAAPGVTVSAAFPAPAAPTLSSCCAPVTETHMLIFVCFHGCLTFKEKMKCTSGTALYRQFYMLPHCH